MTELLHRISSGDVIIIALLVAIVIGLIALTTLAIYNLAHKDIFFTMVPQGEFIAVMRGDKVHRYIGNVTDYWVDPNTGKVTEGKPPESVKMPREIYGIYWIGFWPFSTRYRYQFARTKYAKEKSDSKEYTIQGVTDEADSVYWQASFGIEIKGAETSEGIPITADFVITTQTTNVNTCLFANKSPGWLARVTAAVSAEIRDLIGSSSLIDINKMKAEIGDAAEGSPGGSGKSRLQREISMLNEATHGNPGLDESVGQIVIAINFLGFSIDPTNSMSDTQKASLTKYFADRDKEKEVTAAQAEADKIVIIAKAKLEAAAKEAEGIKLKGEAEAQAARQMTEAIQGNPQIGVMSLAKANNLHTLVIGAPAMTTLGIDGKPKPDQSEKGGVS